LIYEATAIFASDFCNPPHMAVFSGDPVSDGHGSSGLGEAHARSFDCDACDGDEYGGDD